MAQWAYRAGSAVSAGGAVGDALAVAKPTGTAAGDLIVVVCYWEPDTQTITPPAGFVSDKRQANVGAFMGEVFSKIAGSSEPSTYTFTPSANTHFRSIVAAAYQNGTGAGPWVDVTSGAEGDAATEAAQLASTVTTTGVNRLLVGAHGGFNNNATSVIGAASTFRIGAGGACLADAAFASAGATGTTQFIGGGTQDFWAIHVAYISDTPPASSGPTLPFRSTVGAMRI